MKEIENKKTAGKYSLVAGILFAASIAVMLFVGLWQYGFMWQVYWGWLLNSNNSVFLSTIAYAILAFALIKNQRNSIPVIGFVLLTIGELIAIIGTIRNIALGGVRGIILIYDIFYLLSWLSATAVSAVCLTEYLPQYREKVKRLWFVPVIVFVIAYIIELVSRCFGAYGFYLGYLFSRYFLLHTFETIVLAAGMVFALLWCAYPDGIPTRVRTASADGGEAGVDDVATDRAYCGLVKHVLLLLFACGIWLLIWIYRMTDYTNAVKDEEPRNPTTKLLLCMFIPFYMIYWVYKTAQRVDKMAAAKGVSSDMATLCLILEIFVPIIPPILLQDKLNKVITTGTPPVREETVRERSVNGVAAELKTFKELLDSGVITQEEFDAKKKELLGL